MTLISLYMGQLNDRLHNNIITGMSCTCLPASVIATHLLQAAHDQGRFRDSLQCPKCLDQKGGTLGWAPKMRLESAVRKVVLKWSSNEQLPYLIKYILPIIRSI